VAVGQHKVVLNAGAFRSVGWGVWSTKESAEHNSGSLTLGMMNVERFPKKVDSYSEVQRDRGTVHHMVAARVDCAA
jgi:hypothetical protein